MYIKTSFQKEQSIGIFFQNDNILVSNQNQFLIPVTQVYKDYNILNEFDYFYLGQFEDKDTYAFYLDTMYSECPEGMFLLAGREAFKLAKNPLLELLCRAKSLLNWNKISQFCGSCGKKTKLCNEEIAKICSSCSKVVYPTTSPAVIVLIEKGEYILLGRSPHFDSGMYSTLAGFIEAGESCETAIRREIEEEVGLKVTDVSYFGSQAWPFPNSFMLGFFAKYQSGEIKINSELEDAKWFHVSELPILPPESSIAWQMINSYVNKFL